MLKKINLVICLLIVQTILALPALAQSGKDLGIIRETNKVALVIGNSEYKNGFSKLNSPRNDAAAMAAALKRLGFRLVGDKAHFDATFAEMEKLVNSLTDELKNGGVGFFYFSGHGSQDGFKDNFLIPVDTSISYQSDLKHKALKIEFITSRMEETRNRLNILVLDACRNNPLPSGDKSGGKGLNTNSEVPSGVYIAFAARDGQTALDGDYNGYSLYTRELLKNIEEPNERLEDIFIATRTAVKNETKNRQSPFDYGSIDGRFYFKFEEQNSSVGNVSVIERNTPTTTNTNSGEATFWSAIENSNVIVDFENYLKRIDSGEFKGIYKSTAELKIAKLKKASIAAAWTIIRPTANLLLKYDFVNFFSEGLAQVQLNSRWGFISKRGREVISPVYYDVGSFSEGLAWVADTNGRTGFVNKTGFELIGGKYIFLRSFSEGLTVANLNGKYGFIDKSEKVVIPLIYDNASSFSEGLAAVVLNGKWRFINKVGKEVILLKYDSVWTFSEGLVKVKLNGKVGFIDKNGKEVIPLKYDNASSFSNGLAMVKLNGKMGLIDKNGKEIIPLKYEIVLVITKSLTAVKLNGKVGFIDKNGKEVIPLKYDDVWCNAFIEDGFIGVELNGDKGFIDIYGNEYFDF